MKKIIYLILFINLFLVVDVYATENGGTLYEEYWEKSNVNVFAKDVTTGGLDYNGWQVKSNVDDNIYYCIEPEKNMPGISDANNNSHTIYTDDAGIINSSRLNNETLEKVKLLAYYGFNYKQHTSKSWYGITQVMIWRTIRPDINWIFKESRYGNTNLNLYIDEINELTNLVNNHNILPSFNDTEIRLIKNEEYVLTDSLNILQNFTVEDNEYATFKIEGNKLIITPLKEGNIEIKLTREKVENNFSLFASNEYQDLVTRGSVTNKDAKIKLNILDHEIYGLVSIRKQKGADFEEYTNEKDAVFEIYDNENNLIRTLITDENGFASTSLKYGKYKIKQIKGAENYSLNEEFEIAVTEEKEYIYNLKNEKKSKLILYKQDYSSKKLLAGAVFSIYKEDGTLVEQSTTNDKGLIEIEDLELGKYYIVEDKAPKYYILNTEKLYFEINEYGKEIILTFDNERSVGSLEIYKTDGKTNFPLQGAVFEIYDKLTNELVYKGSTDEEGKIFIEDIQSGQYLLKEVKAPAGYQLNEDYIEFEINEKVLVHLSLTNELVENPHTSDHIKSSIILFSLSSIILTSITILNSRRKKK